MLTLSDSICNDVKLDIKAVKKRKRGPEQVWKLKEEKRGQKGIGIDWFLYQEKVLIPKLYEYYETIRTRHPGKEIGLVEDNAGGHAKAGDVIEKYREEHGILKALHPLNSLDLNMIEGLWDYEKDRVEECPIYSGSEKNVEKAKEYVTREWARDGPKAQQLCKSFRDRLEGCRIHEGDNNWRG